MNSEKGITQHFGINLAKLLTEKIILSYPEFDGSTYIKSIKNKKELSKALIHHQQKYQWLSLYNPDDKLLPIEYFEERLNQSTSKDVDKITKEINVNQIIADFSFSFEINNLINLMREYAYLHTFRTEMVAYSFYLLRPLLRALAVKWNADLSSICAFTIDEMITALTKNSTPNISITVFMSINITPG